MQLNSAFAAASRCCGCSHSCRLPFYCHDWPHNIGYGLHLFVRFYGFKLEPVPERPKLISVVDWALVSSSEATVLVSQLGGALAEVWNMNRSCSKQKSHSQVSCCMQVTGRDALDDGGRSS